jgi:hypothetical protein
MMISLGYYLCTNRIEMNVARELCKVLIGVDQYGLESTIKKLNVEINEPCQMASSDPILTTLNPYEHDDQESHQYH